MVISRLLPALRSLARSRACGACWRWPLTCPPGVCRQRRYAPAQSPWISAQPDKDLATSGSWLVHQGQQDVLSADMVIAKPERCPHRQLTRATTRRAWSVNR
jgi:hypothetical protein